LNESSDYSIYYVFAQQEGLHGWSDPWQSEGIAEPAFNHSLFRILERKVVRSPDDILLFLKWHITRHKLKEALTCLVVPRSQLVYGNFSLELFLTFTIDEIDENCTINAPANANASGSSRALCPCPV